MAHKHALKSRVPLREEETMEGIRGMSDPKFFAFNIRKHARTIVCHGVIFTSFEIPSGSESSMTVGTPEDDPRFEEFLRYVWANFLKDKHEEFKAGLAKLDALSETTKETREKLAELEKFLKKEPKP